jgi:hypothetical protein
MAQRVTLRKRNPYNTTSNKRRIVKTPGGKLVYHHIKKNATAPKCGDCGIALPGVRGHSCMFISTSCPLSSTFGYSSFTALSILVHETFKRW